jgi:hypothetical protein
MSDEKNYIFIVYRTISNKRKMLLKYTKNSLFLMKILCSTENHLLGKEAEKSFYCAIMLVFYIIFYLQ